MSKRKYTIGKRITTMAEFEASDHMWFIIKPGSQEWTRHRGVLESMTYHTLKKFLGSIYEADRVEEENNGTKKES